MPLSNIKRILFSGGGTAGSVSPLLAIYDELASFKNPTAQRETPGEPVKKPAADDIFEFLWIGTKNGIERGMVEKEGIAFKPIFSGKLRRYFSLKNFADIAFLKLGFWQSLFIMLKWRPDLVMSAGGFVSVPVVWAAWLLRVPAIIHQQDVRPGLANKLMAPFARAITVTFEKSLDDYGKKAVWTGNPARKILTTPDSQRPTHDFFDKNSIGGNLPILLIVGGGTGAMFINRLAADSLNELIKFCRIIHVTGKNKARIGDLHSSAQDNQFKNANYRVFEFLPPDEMAEAMKNADLVITRAGMSFLTELSILGKPSIIVPIPDSHQEDNARYFAEAYAAEVLEQGSLDKNKFINEVRKIISDGGRKNKLGANIRKIMKPGAAAAVVKIVSRFF